MNINFNPSFTSRNKNIRKADDIQRKAKLAFPIISPTYIDTFYKSINSSDKIKREKANTVAKKYDTRITAIREMVRRHSFEGSTFEEKQLNAPIFHVLRCVEIAKAANCHECAAIAIAGLTANGIFDNQRVNLELDLKYKNKKDGKVEYQASIPIDHTAIRTKIGKDDIIVDPWLGFADSISGANEKYKQLLIDKDINKEIRTHRSLFRLEKSTPDNIINPDKDYELKTAIKYIPAEYSNEKDMAEIGYYTRCFHPELIL